MKFISKMMLRVIANDLNISLGEVCDLICKLAEEIEKEEKDECDFLVESNT